MGVSVCSQFTYRWMPRDKRERSLKQFLAGRDFVPGRYTGWMWERNEIENMAGSVDAKFAADHLF